MRALGFLALAMLCAPAARAQQVTARIMDEPDKGHLTILIGPLDLPSMVMPGMEHDAHMMVLPPVQTVTVPVDAYLYGFGYDVVDAEGKPVPPKVVHHLNLIDPDHRELFLPISQRIGAVGGETGNQELPGAVKYFVGVPLKAGQHVVVSIM